MNSDDDGQRKKNDGGKIGRGGASELLIAITRVGCAAGGPWDPGQESALAKGRLTDMPPCRPPVVKYCGVVVITYKVGGHICVHLEMTLCAL
jgi:hypothetical protein